MEPVVEVQALIGALFNIALVVMIVATMVSAGYTTTFAFNNDPAILGAVTALIFMQIAVAAPIGTWMGRNVEDQETEDQETEDQETIAETA
jgi:flagellar basal body-associated protein FliL